jgi:murein DD-endopeptidase MepM/ murein hydrolase activator NlpD
MFLRSPLKFSRITSSFSSSRFHPVLKKRMPHYGVDYGAPVGTAVHATADGVVTLAGRNGGAGNMVSIRHPNGYQTNYLHLSKYGSGVRKGVRISQGQVIGYVGSTGLSTGPHLDYRVKHNGSWINPLRISSPPVKPLKDDRLQRFLGHALAVLDLLEGGEAPIGARC